MSETPVEASSERAFYHRFAWAYDLLIERPGGPQLEKVASVLHAHGIVPKSRVIDAECGTGSYAVALAASGFSVTAIERSAELLAEAKHRARTAGASIAFVHADITHSWTPEVAADGVLCRGVLNDLRTDDGRRRAFHALASWLRPGSGSAAARPSFVIGPVALAVGAVISRTPRSGSSRRVGGCGRCRSCTAYVIGSRWLASTRQSATGCGRDPSRRMSLTRVVRGAVVVAPLRRISPELGDQGDRDERHDD